MFQRISSLTQLWIPPSQPCESSWKNELSVVKAGNDWRWRLLWLGGQTSGVDHVASVRRCPLRRGISGEDGWPMEGRQAGDLGSQEQKRVYSVYRRTLPHFVTHSDLLTSDMGILVAEHELWQGFVVRHVCAYKVRLIAAAKVARHVCRCVLGLIKCDDGVGFATITPKRTWSTLLPDAHTRCDSLLRPKSPDMYADVY